MSILSRRKKHLGNGSKYFYEKPLHIIKGEDVWLIDEKGKRFLDVYNNVAHVGHSNPRVVNAITEQSKAKHSIQTPDTFTKRLFYWPRDWQQLWRRV